MAIAPDRDYEGNVGYTAPKRSKTTQAERERESGMFYGTENLGSEGNLPTNATAPSATPVGETSRESGISYGSGNTGVSTPSADSSNDKTAEVVKKLVSTYTDPQTGDIVDVYDNGDGTTSTSVRQKGTAAVDAAAINAASAAEKQGQRQSAYDLLYEEFNKYGLGGLVNDIKGLIMSGAPKSEYTIRLRESDTYKKRFAGNAARVAKGLQALDEAAYVDLEDQYQNVMRNYGLPADYWQKDSLGTQKGFTDLIANDVSSTELEKRVLTAQDFMDKGPKAYVDAIKKFYPEIDRGDLLAYVLDPNNALPKIQAKIGAAKIGGEYLNAGLTADQKRAEELQRLGVTGEAARQGAQFVKETAPLGSQYAAMYGLEPYGQAEAEEEVYGLGKAAEAKKKREKIVGAVTADFSGKSGVGVLDANRSGGY